MPDIGQNVSTWTNYEWPRGGDEWSDEWGNSDMLWWGTLFPRIAPFLPTQTVLEIAPGFGRCTTYLKNFCEHLAMVDVTERCIEACKERFGEPLSMSFFVNDGRTIPLVPDNSIDFVFSYDSLVHVEADSMQSYVHECSRMLKPNGVGFFHHSNIGAFINPETGELPFENIHWRAMSMSAKLFEQFCDEAGLQCIGQEIVNWGGEMLIDAFSLFTPKGSRLARENIVVENPNLMREANMWRSVAPLYRSEGFAHFNRTGKIGTMTEWKPSKERFAIQRLSGLVLSRLKR